MEPTGIWPIAKWIFSPLREYALQARSLLKQGAQVVVAPEKIVVVQEENIKALDALFAEASAGSGGDVVVGVARRAAREWLNEARVYTPGTGAPLTYEKQHMLPPFETRFTVGTTRTILQRPSGLWGVTICKDMEFPLLSREYGRENVPVAGSRVGLRLRWMAAWPYCGELRTDSASHARHDTEF